MGLDFTWQTGVALVSQLLTAKATLTAIDSIERAEVLGRVGRTLGLGSPPEKVVLYHYENISDNTSADYSEVDIRGRSQPFVTYAKTNANKISFEGKLVAGADVAGLTSPSAVFQDMLMLKSWLYPRYKEDSIEPPPLLQLDVGSVYQGVPGLIRSLDIVMERPWTLDHLPYIATVTIEFEILYSQPVDRDHVREGMRDSGVEARGRFGYLTEKLGRARTAAGNIFKNETYTGVWGSVKDKATDLGEKASLGWEAGRGKNVNK
jgi:hypothetical protein